MIGDTIRNFLQDNAIGGPLLAALSGGPDSTALLVALHELGDVPFTAAHVNHHLRGADSDADEAFVRDLCARLGVTLRVADGSLDPALIRKHGLEAAAREVRHARLQEIRRDAGAAYIVTAHQKNDQAETVLMRLFSGGGIAALRGIHPVRDDGVIRPLLEVTRAEVEDFLRRRGIEARVDGSNADPRFLRNRMRALLATVDISVVENLASVARQARRQWRSLEWILDREDHSVTTGTETRFASLPDDPWLRQALLLRHIRRLDSSTREVSAADLERLVSQLETLTRVSVTRALELLRRNGQWILRRKPQPVDDFEFELDAGEEKTIESAGITVGVFPSNDIRRPKTQVIQLPHGSEAHFVVRNRRRGDRFQPLGMAQEKKLKDFLIDRKIAVETRDRIPLLLWQGTIACVGGVEVSEAFKVVDGGGERYEVAIEESHPEGVQRQTDRRPHP